MFFNFPFVSRREVSFNRNNYGVVVVFLLGKLMLFELAEIKLTDPFCKDLFQAWAELVTLGNSILRLVGEKTK